MPFPPRYVPAAPGSFVSSRMLMRAQVVFGVIVTRGPCSHLADAAMSELDKACDLFSMAAKLNRRAAKAHVSPHPPTYPSSPALTRARARQTILCRLQDKAHRALDTARSAQPRAPEADGASWDIKQEELDDELSIFAGRAKILRAGPSAAHPYAYAALSPEDHRLAPGVALLVPRAHHDAAAGQHGGFADAAPYRAPANVSMMREWLAQSAEGYREQEYYQPPPQHQQHQQQMLPPQAMHQHAQYARQVDDAGAMDPLSHRAAEYGLPHGAHGAPSSYPPSSAASASSSYAPPLTPTGVSHPHQHQHPHQQQHTHTQIQPPYAYPMSQDGRLHAYSNGSSVGGGFGHSPQPLPLPELADLGLQGASSPMRDNWSYFVQRSGILDGRNA